MRRSLGPSRSPTALAILLLLAACATPPGASPSPEPVATPSSAATATPEASASATGAPSATPQPEPLAWTQLEAAGPAAREDHTWTVDPETGISYLFGGRDGATVFGDTWAYDLASDTWTELAPSASPDARFGHEAVWADGIGLVIFAGQAGSVFFGDLWAYDPAANAWAELPATGATPTPRYGSCAAIGPDARLWISHGFTQDGIRFFDTRAYDFGAGTWTDETPSDGPRPVERCLHGCWWTGGGELALYGGQTTGTLALEDRWRLADGAWVAVEGSLPAARNLYARARLNEATLVFGGQAVDGSYLGDLWSLADGVDDATPLELFGDGPQPAGRAGGELIVDNQRGRALLFGGRTADGALADLWALGGL
ncbi:MAG: Kelch repeat-containing protein [Candidatus Limnocylindria bacterium]